MSAPLDRVEGCLLGCAVGDALGLPWEGTSAPRLALRLAPGPLEHAMIPLTARGVVSDDTEHSLVVAQSLLEAGADPGAFGRALARRLRWWFVTLPPGLGLGTGRAMVRLLAGLGPERSGVWTAGNGPAMRAAVLGVCVDDLGELDALVAVCSRITHTDPRAEEGARVVARLAHDLSRRSRDPAQRLRWALGCVEGEELRGHLQRVIAALEPPGGGPAEPLAAIAAALDQADGISGYVNHTVPIAIAAALLHADGREAIEQAVRLGGDTDTVAAIAGALVGARDGVAGLPASWIEGLWEWPRDVPWIRELARRLVEGGAPLPEPLWIQPLRNLGIGALAVGHVLARWLHVLTGGRLPRRRPRSG